MSRGIESQKQQWPHRVAALKTAAPTDWSRARPGPLVDTPLREQDPNDVFSSRPYSGPTCSICGRPTPMVSGPHCRHGVRVRLALRRIVSFDDWEPNQWGTGFESRLENGHSLFVVQSRQKPELGWQWGIWNHNHPDPDVRSYPVRKGGQLWGGDTESDPQDHLPTAEHAKAQAAEHYKQMFPIGTDTGGHDSGVDYSDLNSYLRHLSRRVLLRIAMPMPTNLQLSGDQPDYSGSHGMQVMQDDQGDWSFKQPKPSLAFTVPLEAAATDLQRKMGLEAPESYVINHQGKPAVVSKWYPNSTQAFHKPPHINELSPDDHMEIQKNHVLDWLIGNHDSHVGNWMRTQDGKLVSIDKGQAAKYFGHDRLDPQFHPNYYAREPIYNQLWRDHAAGRGQMHDPRTGELGAFVKQVQSIPDDHLKEMFRPYAESAARSGLLANPDGDPSRELGPRTLPANSPQHFLDALVARKNNLHNDLGDYYDRMSNKGRDFVGAYKTPPGLHSISDVARAMGVSPPIVHRWLGTNRRSPAPEPTHIVNDTRYWDSLDPWHDWNSGRNKNPGRPTSKENPGRPTRNRNLEPDLSKLWKHTPVDPRNPTDLNNRHYNDLSSESELLRSLHGQPGPGEGADQLPRYAAAEPGAAQQGTDLLYLPGDVADHLGVPRPTLMTWVYNNETPTPTHTSKPHEEMWDNLDVWDKWYTRRKSLKAGPRGYPDGWAAEFQSNKKPQRMLTIPDISQETGMSLSDVYKSVYRPESTSAKLPRNTHFAVGDDKRGVHFWDSLRPTKKRERNGSIKHHTASEDGIALTQWLGWCMHNRKPADRSSLSEYAAISGMDPESYLDIYMFLANSDNGIFRDAAGG